MATVAASVQTSIAGLPDTQTLLDARKNAHATYEEVHAAQMQQIYELDLAMAVFEALNPRSTRNTSRRGRFWIRGECRSESLILMFNFADLPNADTEPDPRRIHS